MGVSVEIKTGLYQATEYEKGNIKARKTTLTTSSKDTEKTNKTANKNTDKLRTK